MNLIRTLLAVVSFSVLLIACASPTGLAVGADSGENTPNNSNNSVATQIIANEISDLSSNANIMEQNQEVIVDSLTQIASIQSDQENMMEQFQQQLAELSSVDQQGNYIPNGISGSGPIDFPPLILGELDTKMEFLEELVVGQIADSALYTNDALSEITKVEQEISNALESEIKALREENEKANEKALKISEDSNKEIELISIKLKDLTNDTATSSSMKGLQNTDIDLLNQINDLRFQLALKTDQIVSLELENKKLSDKLSSFIHHYNVANQHNRFFD